MGVERQAASSPRRLLSKVMFVGWIASLAAFLAAITFLPCSFIVRFSGWVAALLGIVIWRGVVSSLSGSIDVLVGHIRSCARGEFRPSVPSVPDPGLDFLRQELQQMVEVLAERVQQLEASDRHMRAILGGMVEGVIALDREGRILWLNGSAQRLLGIASGQATNQRFTELVRHPEMETMIHGALSQRRPAMLELHQFAPHEQAIRFHATPCEAEQGGAALVLVAHDVTEIRRLEGLRREFVANVSHELKTPLTSIQSLVETLLNGALEDPAHNRRFVTSISEDTTRLSRLIDDLLELSQIESKASPLTLEPVRIGLFLESLTPLFRPVLDERRVSLRVLVPPEAPPVLADPERLRQIFVNLLDNAVKFNRPDGQVLVRAHPEGGELRIEIEDSGIGIPEADLPRIFERFYRVDRARSRALGGTGLGLAIVKHLVELHRGTIEVRSRIGEGSTFTLSLPLAP